MVSNADYARLSEDIYQLDESYQNNPNNVITRKRGFELLNYEDNLTSGFTAATYRNLETNEIIVSFGGTGAGQEDRNDIIANTQLFRMSGIEPWQQFSANVYINSAIANYPDSDISITGHSLGGALAQYAGLNSGLKTVTFNSAPIPFFSSSHLDSANILNLRTLDDELSRLMVLATKMERGAGLSRSEIAANEDILDTLVSELAPSQDSPSIFIGRDASFWKTMIAVGVSLNRNKIGDAIYENQQDFVSFMKSLFGVPENDSLSRMFATNEYFLSLTGGGHSMDFILTEAVYQENLFNFKNLNSIPEIDLSSLNAEPIIGEVAQVGSIDDFIALSGNDFQNEQAVLVAEFASPDGDTEIPVDPVDPVDPLPSANTVRSFVAAVSLDSEGPETGWQFTALEGLSNDGGELSSVDINVPAGLVSVTTTGSPRGSPYSHLQYGVSTDATTFVRNGQTFEASNAHWLYGNFTPANNLALRTGTASYAGELFGHAYDVEGPDLSAAFNSVTGDFTLSVDFSTNQASLEGNIVGLGPQALSFSGGLNRDFYDLNEGGRPSLVVSDVTDVGLLGITTQSNLAFPVELDVPKRTSSGQDDGYLYGSFFGDNASEFGGTFAFALDDTLAIGFAIFETADNTIARRGGITVTELNSSTLDAETTGSSTNELTGVSVNTADLENSSFDYVSWGSWNNSGSYLGQDVSSGTIAFGQITPEDSMPSGGTRNFGTASANSQVAGIGTDGSTIDGSVQLTAEFGANRGGRNGVEVNGSFDFDRDGNDWASGTFSTENDVLRSNGFSADMTVDQGGDGRMFGNFAGPNAEEVFGNWQLNGVNDADLGSAQGIFRAN